MTSLSSWRAESTTVTTCRGLDHSTSSTISRNFAGWLAGGRVADEPSSVVNAFERVEATFGRAWIEASRVQRLVVPKGSSPTTTIAQGSSSVLAVVRMSKLLASLEGVPEADSLVEGLRRGNRAYEAEATAIHLLRLDGDDSIVDLYPVVPVAGRHDRRGDFRVRRGVDPWVYVEVSATDRTAREREASHLLETLSHPIESMNGSFAVELFFHNVPDAREVDIIRQLLGGLNGRSDSTAAELPGGLGVLVFDKDRDPVDVSPRVKNDPYRPGLGRSTVIHRDGEVRSISVRLPYADTRGHAKVSKESKQLPKDGPGLVMIDVAGAPGSHHSWEPTIRADLRNHSRVSAVLLFRWGLRAGAAPRCNIVDFG